MQIVIVLIGASLLVALGFLAAYLWAVKSGQYDDKYTPSVRILFDENKKAGGGFCCAWEEWSAGTCRAGLHGYQSQGNAET